MQSDFWSGFVIVINLFSAILTFSVNVARILQVSLSF